MFVRNTDTGKWSNQLDVLSKDNYDNLRQDLEKTRLFSKCLSGSTYLPIDGFQNIYNTFDVRKIGFYIRESYAAWNLPLNGPTIEINRGNANEFYNKYLKENAFTIKNLFTPNKLIKDQLNNYLIVDVATSATTDNIGEINANLIVDGVKLVEGNRVLIKNQTSIINLASNIDPEIYFSTVELVSEYFLDTDDITSRSYFWYNNENGIYTYNNNRLVKTNELDNYENAYRYSVVVSSGLQNREKQFHLARLKNGYYPVSSENNNMQFVEKHNWVLRNRIDYNNIFDLNYYDIISHVTQSVYVQVESKTYSIPPRTIIVGEFGAIINNQDRVSASATYSQSNIIDNKFKVNLRSIVEVDNYYWTCGDEGTLLRISKHNYQIERIKLDEVSNLNSVSFFGNLYGMTVGDFNTIWWTKDGGLKWNKLVFSEFDIYSYNKVVYYDLNRTYVGGDVGVFIEFSYINGTWISYKRKVSKQLNLLDEFVMVEDINDMAKTDWVKIIASTVSRDNSSIQFGENLVYVNSESDSFGLGYIYNLNIELSSRYFGLQTFSSSQFFGAIEVEDVDGNIIYTNTNYNSPFVTVPNYPAFQSWDFYLSNFNPVPVGTNKFQKLISVSLPLQSNGNLKNTRYKINVKLYYNYDAIIDSTSVGYTSVNYSYFVDTKTVDLLVLVGNNSTVICYDIDKQITKSDNQFIYFTPTQSFSDVRSLTINGGDLFLIGDKVYSSQLASFNNNETINNTSTGPVTTTVDKFVNKFIFNKINLLPYIIGNNSLNQFYSLSSMDFVETDPTFNSRIKSKFLYLDYDVASKLNFFTDEGEYRLPDSVTFSQQSFTQSFVIRNISGENNWIDYYKDAEKTFTYNSSISNSDKVEFSTTFSYYGRPSTYIINNTEINSNLSEILPLAPSIQSSTFSRFIQNAPISLQYTTNYRLLLYKYLSILKLSFNKNLIDSGASPLLGEVLRLQSSVIDCNLVINRIEAFVYNSSVLNSPRTRINWPSPLLVNQSVDLYLYCYSDFNNNIIKNLQSTSGQITITNLNKYTNIQQLVDRFELHPVSIGYSMTKSSDIITIAPRFNNKTAYYNLQANASIGSESKNLTYKESFLNFGYTPTYNLLDYLEKIDSRFYPSYKFTILAEYYGIPGNNGGSFTNSNIFVDLTVGPIVGTNSYYRTGTNQIIFGQDYKFQYDSLLLFTFVNLSLFDLSFGNIQTQRLLIIKKYYRSDINGYVIEFHKKIECDDSIANLFNVYSVDIISRNTLLEISEDLQMLNNIQRTSITKSVEYLKSFSSLENELISKFPTDSYYKVLACDYNIREYISGIIYTDSDYQIAMSLMNVEEKKKYTITNTFKIPVNGFVDKLGLIINTQHELKVGDLVDLSFYGGTNSSQTLNPQYFGLHTIIDSVSSFGFSYVVTSLDYGIPCVVALDLGTISFVKKDPFLNFIPVDLFDLGSDKKLSRAIEVNPENYVFVSEKYNLVDLDLNKFRYRLVDGLSLEELTNRFSWVLEAEISDAILGRDKNGELIWYKGTWHCGRWFGGTWNSGRWVSGDWYSGKWNSFNIVDQKISVLVDSSFVDNTDSKWYGGRWYGGTWNGGTWYDGRWYGGDWSQGNWYGGIWNDGNWIDGRFEGGVWVLGTWNTGIFTCDAKPAYFLDGVFRSGDFENGIWYNGQFGNDRGRLTRFGTRSTNSRNSLWQAGRWIDGEFHSFLNTNSSTGLPDISDIHKYSIWKTGVWLRGNFYGGIAYNIDFKSGTWHGGILEEIQVIGVDPILPATASSNSITLNGIFKFNPGDFIWIIDDDRNGAFSPIGNNTEPRKYRINQILEDDVSEQTKIYLNFNLSILGVNSQIATQSYSNVETGLRVVSYFKDSYWKSGIWTNGIFDNGQFDTGIWYNGVFDGNWGN
jgi:hypothetical protein